MARVPAERSARWGDLGLRVASAAVLAPIALVCIWYGGPAFVALVALAGVGLAVEWLQLCRYRPTTWPAWLLPVAVLGGSVLAPFDAFGPVIAALVVVGIILVAWPTPARGWLAAGVAYIAPAVLALLWLRADPVVGRINLLFVLLLIWATDVGAYLAGRLVGGPRLAPRVSPGKTWSGAVGGLVAAVGAAWATAASLHPPAAPLKLIILAVGLGVTAQAGDLLESLIKRYFGVKDSGHVIPGHGGLFDRLDALLAVAPLAAILALMAGRGVVLWE
ncbi:MAG: phosphatidate cytidylyltransferase [Acetobacteraceae bacterium]|nr:phosphatidate cytidylyltransferase [Acetobacteraceae bacterium]